MSLLLGFKWKTTQCKTIAYVPCPASKIYNVFGFSILLFNEGFFFHFNIAVIIVILLIGIPNLQIFSTQKKKIVYGSLKSSAEYDILYHNDTPYITQCLVGCYLVDQVDSTPREQDIPHRSLWIQVVIQDQPYIQLFITKCNLGYFPQAVSSVKDYT